jgi:hypothetical protein
MPRCTKKRLLIGALLVLAGLSISGVQVSWASWIEQAANSPNGVDATSVGNVGTASAAAAHTSNANSLCQANSITITWTSATNATSYLVEKQLNGGSWQTVNADTGDVTSITDPGSYSSNELVAYRVIGLLGGTSWTSMTPAVTNSLQCGVVDLTATQPCNSVVLDWSAAEGATTYDIWRSEDGGANWGLVTSDVAATTYTVTTSHTTGTDVRYRVVPGYDTTTPNYASNSNETPQLTAAGGTGWQAFRVLSVTVADALTLGTLKAGDTVTTTFSKPVLTSSVALATSIRTRKGNNHLYLAASTNSDSEIGDVSTTSIYGTTANYGGTATWTNGDTTLVWTSTGTGTTQSADLSTSTGWSASSTVTCADGTTTLASTPLPVFSGRW